MFTDSEDEFNFVANNSIKDKPKEENLMMVKNREEDNHIKKILG